MTNKSSLQGLLTFKAIAVVLCDISLHADFSNRGNCISHVISAAIVYIWPLTGLVWKFGSSSECQAH